MWWNAYIGIPFAEKGRGPDGVDCWGLVQLVYRQERGIELPGYEWCYETTNDRDSLSFTIDHERIAKWNTVETPHSMDVVILKMRGVPMHVGLITKKNHMIHCARGIGTVHEPYNGMRWHNKIAGFSRYG